MTDPISDMLTRIRNASLARKEDVLIEFSKMSLAIAKILLKEGYILNVKNVKKTKSSPNGYIKIKLKYREDTFPVIQKLQRVSKPGQRIYVSRKNIPKVLNNLGISILSTSKGIMTNQEAQKRQIGGELLCSIW